MAITIRPFRPGDEAAINEGFNAAFGLERPLADWEWKFADGPEGRWIVVAENGAGTVLAHFAVVPVRMQVGKRELLAGQAVDSYARRRAGLAREGLFERTTRSFYDLNCGPDRIALLYGFPGTRHLRLGLARLGYVAPQPVAYWRRAVGSRAARRPLWSPYRVEKGFDSAAADALWQGARGRYPFAAVRDAAWLRRRFSGRPGVDYLHLGASHRRRCEAWGVLRAVEGAVRWAELVWDGADPRALVALDREADAVARAAGAPYIDLWLAGDPVAAAVLADLGWQEQPEPQDLHVTFVSFHPALPIADLAPRLYYTLGDSDLV
jgi:hypothetical protein